MFIVIHCALLFGRGIQFLWGVNLYRMQCITDAVTLMRALI